MPRLIVVGTINRYDPPGPDWEVVHVDRSDRGIWNPHGHRNEPIDLIADMRALPFPASSADRIQSWHALEHVNQQGGRDTIAEFARVLKPYGVLDIRVPDMEYVRRCESIDDVLRLTYGDQTVMPDPDLNVHRWGYSARTLRALLAEHRFDAAQIAPEHEDEIHMIATLRPCN